LAGAAKPGGYGKAVESSGMTVVMTLLVRNGADILRENIAFHLERGVDFVIVMDNRSEDETAAIVRGFEREGVARYLYQAQDDYAQSAWVTEMARMAFDEYGAGWVINSDDDEFWFPHRGSLKSTLHAFGADVSAVSAQRTNFVARPEDGRPFWQRMTVRTVHSCNVLGNPLPPKVAHRGAGNVVVVAGNHSVRFDDDTIEAIDAAIDILHFPVRSRPQYLGKVVNGGRALERNTRIDVGIGETWRWLYERYLEGSFDDEYHREVRSDDDVALGIRRGDLVTDLRLFEALAR
jgi:hypothetical protein